MNKENYNLTILYVDDEAQALKYFARAYEEDFHIHTCESARDALEYLDKNADSVGVIISDQRMPNQTGVSLLETVRKRYPHIVRILTTAYAELDNAIDAVNEGAVFRYVTKPWNINELKSVLKNAMDFAIVREERDLLLHEKLSTIQRILIMERSRYLAVIASSLSQTLNNTCNAVRDYVHLSDMTCEKILKITELKNIDLSMYGPEETRKMGDLACNTANNAQMNQSQLADVLLADLVQEAVKETDLEIPVDIQATDLSVPVYADLIKFAIKSFINQVICKSTRFLVEKTEDGACISITNNLDSDNMMDSLFSILRKASVNDKLDDSVFTGFLFIYHHGGHITITESTEYRCMKIVIPESQTTAESNETDYSWLDDVFDNLETAWY